MKRYYFFGVIFAVLLLVIGCTQEVIPKQIISDAPQPQLEQPQEIQQTAEEQTTTTPENEAQESEQPIQEKPISQDKPLPQATLSEEISEAYSGEADLKRFPTMFVGLNKNDEKVFNGLLVVGKKAPVTDVIAAQNAAAGVNNGIRRPRYLISAVLDTQVADIKAQNAIVIGNPCDNTAAAVLLGNNECDANLQLNKALIKIFENNGHIQMVIVGNTATGTLRASEYLKEYYKYEWEGTRFEFTY
jgi:hypothetical protein